MWQLWEPAVQPTKRLDFLCKPGEFGDEHTTAYAYVFDLSPEGGEDQSGEVIRFSFHYGGVSAEVIRSGNAEFSTNKHRKGWGFDDVPLVRSGLLKDLVEALKEVSTPTCTYCFYFDDITVIIVRELIVEPDPEVETRIPQTCVAGGQHLLDGTTSILNTCGSRPRQVQACVNCGCLIDLCHLIPLGK